MAYSKDTPKDNEEQDINILCHVFSLCLSSHEVASSIEDRKRGSRRGNNKEVACLCKLKDAICSARSLDEEGLDLCKGTDARIWGQKVGRLEEA